MSTNKDTDSTQVLDLARAYARRQIGTLPAEALDFAAMLILNAELTAANYPGLTRHPAFRTLGLRLGASEETVRWNKALAEAAATAAGNTHNESVVFELTEDRGMVLRTQSLNLDNSQPRERSLTLQLIKPEPWIAALLPEDFLRRLVDFSSRSLPTGSNEADDELQRPQAENGAGNTEQPRARFFPVPLLKGLASELSAVILSPERRYMGTIADKSRLVVYDRLTVTRMDLGKIGLVRQAQFRPQNIHDEICELAVVGDIDSLSIQRINVLDGSRLEELPMNATTAIAYSKDSRYFAAGNVNGLVRVWRLAEDKVSLLAEGKLSAQITSLAFHSANHSLYATVFGGTAGELKITASPAKSAVQALTDHGVPHNLKQVATGIRGDNVYFVGSDGQIYAVCSKSGEVGVISPNIGAIKAVDVFSTSGHLCAVGENTVYIAHAAGPKTGKHLTLHCRFDEDIIGVAELDDDAVLVFHDQALTSRSAEPAA